MSLPSAVKKQSEEAEKLQEELNKEHLEVVEAPKEEKEEPKQEPKKEEPAPEIDRMKLDFERLKHQKDVLQGKYNAEVPRMAGEIAELKDLIKKQTPEEKPIPHVTDKQREEYGDDFIDFARNVAKDQIGDVSSRIEKLEVENERLRSVTDNAASSVRVNQEDAFYTALDSFVPDWKALNKHAEFLEWLAENDPFTGSPRHNLLEDAHAQLDASRVANFFTAFLKASPPKTTPQLESQIVPSKQGTAQTETSKPTYTRPQISAFYRDVTAGKYRGREAESEQIERDIFAATNEGRIV